MKRITLLFAVVATALFAFKSVDQSTWEADKAHSKLGFEVTHLMVSDVEGSFKNFSAKVISSKEDFSDAVVELSADVASVNTENDQRDAHLKGPEFFDAAKYPTLTFKSTSVKKTSGNKYKVAGNLNFHGVTKPIVLDAVLRGVTVNPMSKKPVAGFKVTGTIKRSDFNFGSKFPGAMLSDEVTLNANTEFVKN
ncbi:MAG: YceI family protein [Pedobacter sp.]|jgi:polyisoprenoid-binding protein YceI|nr:YceI family protein [Pedobacter sp.]